MPSRSLCSIANMALDPLPARKGKHYDFWIKKPGAGYHFGGERSLRVEVSGIFCGSGRVNGRLRAKLRQMARQSVPLAGLAMVAEFGSPLVASGKVEN